jgi:hypothetical protein
MSLGYALRRWVLASVVGLFPSPLGSSLRRWAMPFSIVGFWPPSLGYALLRRWVVPFSVVGLCPMPLGCALPRRWVVPLVVPYTIGLCPWLYPTPLGYALHR